MNFNLIPFGLKSDGTFVDVHDVENGLNCNCSCPSCHNALIARQGDVKEWHFAHAKQDHNNTTENDCEYSFYVSVRLMARQIIQDELEINLPAYEDQVSEFVSPYHDDLVEPFVITKAQIIHLSSVKTDQLFNGHPVDILGTILGHQFVLYLTHPNRIIPPSLEQLSNEKCGVIEINLNKTNELFLQSRNKNLSYQQVLYDFIVRDISSKQWVFHPRYQICKQEAEKQLAEQSILYYKRLKQDNLQPQEGVDFDTVEHQYKPMAINTTRKKANFECIDCQTHWQDWEPGPRKCPKCDSHLYVRLINYIQ